ncbi:hypothetical protein [Streptomyces sp. NPDC050704]|uniref:hypothetical protein n=1 Tax=Streptomyces sp. NPDC050704 TaxID=3157219 RepID=UPI00342E57AB
MVVASGGSAFAALRQPNGGLVPLQVQGGSVGLLSGTNSVKVTVAGTGSTCTAVNGSGNLATGWQLSEGDSITIDSFTDKSCQGSQIGSGIAYTLTYSGPDPKNSFSHVLVRARSAAVFVCSDSGWTDGDISVCRNA